MRQYLGNNYKVAAHHYRDFMYGTLYGMETYWPFFLLEIYEKFEISEANLWKRKSHSRHRHHVWSDSKCPHVHKDQGPLVLPLLHQ